MRAVGLCMAPVGLDKADHLAPFLYFLQKNLGMESIVKERGGCAPSQAQSFQSISMAAKRGLFWM